MAIRLILQDNITTLDPRNKNHNDYKPYLTFLYRSSPTGSLLMPSHYGCFKPLSKKISLRICISPLFSFLIWIPKQSLQSPLVDIAHYNHLLCIFITYWFSSILVLSRWFYFTYKSVLGLFMTTENALNKKSWIWLRYKCLREEEIEKMTVYNSKNKYFFVFTLEYVIHLYLPLKC